MRTLASLIVVAAVFAARPATAQSHAAFPDLPAAGRAAPATPPARPESSPVAAEPRAREPIAFAATSWGAAPAAAASDPAPTSPLVTGTWGSGGSLSFGAPAREPTGDVGTGLSAEDGPATTPLVIGGVALGLPYLTGLGVGAAQGFENGSGWLVAPVIGPWLAMSGRRDPCEGASSKHEFDSDVGKCVAEPLIRGMLVLDGVLQASGAVLLVIGASSHETHIVKKPAPSVAAAPTTIGRDGYGVAVAGRF